MDKLINLHFHGYLYMSLAVGTSISPSLYGSNHEVYILLSKIKFEFYTYCLTFSWHFLHNYAFSLLSSNSPTKMWYRTDGGPDRGPDVADRSIAAGNSHRSRNGSGCLFDMSKDSQVFPSFQ